ncbi:MAG: ornithine cyclodeaminase family protein [Hyphomicrobiaceae bacterium]
MARFLSEADIASLVTIDDAIDAVTGVFSVSSGGAVINPPRQQIDIPAGYLRLTSAIVGPLNKIAVKVSSSMVFDSDSGRLLLLLDSRTGRADALIEVFRLGQLRTAAASGVATRHLARSDARSVGIFGAGRQAQTQLLAMVAVRPIEKVLVAGRDPQRLTAFCKEMQDMMGIPVRAVRSPEEVYACDILIAATTSKTPVILGDHVRPGTHINAIGANRMERREVDDTLVGRCAIIAVDSKPQARKESAALVEATASGLISWDDVMELGDCVSKHHGAEPASDAITLYNSHGIAMEDVALATKAYELAVERGIGHDIPLTLP